MTIGPPIAALVSTVVMLAGPVLAQPIVYDSGPVTSANKRYLAVQGSDQRSTVIFKRLGQTKREKLYETPAWSPALYLADDGDHLVIGYEGGNLLSQRYRLDQIMVSFYRHATLIRSVALSEIILDPKHLQASDSGVQWGFFVGLIGSRKFALDTVERRRLVFDITTGKLLSVVQPDRSSLLSPD